MLERYRNRKRSLLSSANSSSSKQEGEQDKENADNSGIRSIRSVQLPEKFFTLSAASDNAADAASSDSREHSSTRHAEAGSNAQQQRPAPRPLPEEAAAISPFPRVRSSPLLSHDSSGPAEHTRRDGALTGSLSWGSPLANVVNATSLFSRAAVFESAISRADSADQTDAMAVDGGQEQGGQQEELRAMLKKQEEELSNRAQQLANARAVSSKLHAELEAVGKERAKENKAQEKELAALKLEMQEKLRGSEQTVAKVLEEKRRLEQELSLAVKQGVAEAGKSGMEPEAQEEELRKRAAQEEELRKRAEHEEQLRKQCEERVRLECVEKERLQAARNEISQALEEAREGQTRGAEEGEALRTKVAELQAVVVSLEIGRSRERVSAREWCESACVLVCARVRAGRMVAVPCVCGQ